VVVVPNGGAVHSPDVVQDACFPDDTVKFAVVSGDWDHIESILTQLGVKHDVYDGNILTFLAIGFLSDFNKMSEYDAIFFDCGADHYDILNAAPQLITQNLINFVANGGSVYASDWAFVYPEWAWPNAIDFFGGNTNNQAPKVGAKSSLAGTVIDAGLAGFLGKTSVSINYNLSSWVVVSGAPLATTVYINGTVPQVGAKAPLMLSHTPAGQAGGRVLFTTFHNENQPTADMINILKYVVFEL